MKEKVSRNILDVDDSLIKRFWEKVDKSPGQGANGDCWEWISQSKDSYQRISYKNQLIYVHRLSFFLHHGKWANPMTCHTCDNPRCVNPTHLFEGTNLDNVKDMVAKKRHTLGSKNNWATITEKDVEKILSARMTELSATEIAKNLNLSSSLVEPIIYGENWKHVKRPDGISNINLKSRILNDNQLIQAITEKITTNVSYKELGKKFGLSSGNMRYNVRKFADLVPGASDWLNIERGSKLNKFDVMVIKTMLNTHSIKQISAIFDVAVGTVQDIKKGWRWKTV